MFVFKIRVARKIHGEARRQMNLARKQTFQTNQLESGSQNIAKGLNASF